MDKVTQIATEIVTREGGYVNDPDDPGGATNHGVTIHTMKRLGLDLTKDGRITPEDVRRLTREQAVRIFIDHYYKRPRINELPEVIRASVFDMYVNAGSHAVKILQRLLTDMRLPCAVDGVLGPQTIALASKAVDLAPDHLLDAYGIARRNYYYRLADKRPKSRKYALQRNGGKGGWIARAEEFISPQYHLSKAEHSERVASWA